MKYKVYLDELEEESLKIINYSDKEIHDKIEELKVLGDEINWHGGAHDKFIIEYNEGIKKLNKLNRKIRLFGEYLKFCKDHYGETQEKLRKDWEEYLDEVKKKGDIDGV